VAAAVEFPVEELRDANLIAWKKLASAMRCSRGRGLMVIEPCFDHLAWRCVQCGDVIDPVILQNRQRLGMGVSLRHLRQDLSLDHRATPEESG